MKQETLEEFIDKVDTPSDFDQFTFDEGIRVGAKWQDETNKLNEQIIVAQEELIQLQYQAIEARNKYIAILESQLKVQDTYLNK